MAEIVRPVFGRTINADQTRAHPNEGVISYADKSPQAAMRIAGRRNVESTGHPSMGANLFLYWLRDQVALGDDSTEKEHDPIELSPGVLEELEARFGNISWLKEEVLLGQRTLTLEHIQKLEHQSGVGAFRKDVLGRKPR